MKCQKCMQPAVVHLTELLSDGPVKKAVEIHLCFEHAVESGLIAPQPGALPTAPVVPMPTHTHVKKKPKPAPATDEGETADTGLPPAIVPSSPPGGLSVVRKEPVELPGGACPICGNTWAAFKQTGQMGCPHDYAHFELKILPLVKRAQEGAVQHSGKVPSKIEHAGVVREVTTTRLRRELQKAIDAERYEEAAKLRDQLKQLGTN